MNERMCKVVVNELTWDFHAEQDEDTGMFVGRVPETFACYVPGMHSQGATLEELHSNMREVIELCTTPVTIEGLKQDIQDIMEDRARERRNNERLKRENLELHRKLSGRPPVDSVVDYAADARQLIDALDIRARRIAAAMDDHIHGDKPIDRAIELTRTRVGPSHRGHWSYDPPQEMTPLRCQELKKNGLTKHPLRDRHGYTFRCVCNAGHEGDCIFQSGGER